MAIAIRTTRLALIRAHIDRGGRKARRAGGARVPSWAPACASRQRRPAYRVSHLAGQGRARSSPSPAPTFEVNKWKRLSSPPSVARLISAAHLSSRGTKGAQRRGQLRPSLGGVQGAAAAPSARPPALHPAAWSQVRSARRAHNCGAARTAAGRGRTGGRRRSVTISARILTNQDLPAGGGAQRPGLQGGRPVPPRRPRSLPGFPARAGARLRFGACPQRSPLGRPSPTRVLAPLRALSAPAISSHLRCPCSRCRHFSSHRNTHTHAHTRTRRAEAPRGGGGKETGDQAQIGTCGWF